MTENAPSTWDLQRQLSQIREDQRAAFTDVHARLDRVASTETLLRVEAGQRDKLDELARDLAEEVAARRHALTEESTARKAADAEIAQRLDKLGERWRWLVAAVLVPVSLAIASLYMARGGAS